MAEGFLSFLTKSFLFLSFLTKSFLFLLRSSVRDLGEGDRLEGFLPFLLLANCVVTKSASFPEPNISRVLPFSDSCFLSKTFVTTIPSKKCSVSSSVEKNNT